MRTVPRCERLDLELERPQKQLERAEALIVVDGGDDASVTPADRMKTQASGALATGRVN